MGTILSDPADIPEEKAMKKFFLTNKFFNTIQLRSVLSIDVIMPKRMEKSIFQNHPLLSHLTILRQPIGTNFKLTQAEAQAIEQLAMDMFGKDFFLQCTTPSADSLPTDSTAPMESTTSSESNSTISSESTAMELTTAVDSTTPMESASTSTTSTASPTKLELLNTDSNKNNEFYESNESTQSCAICLLSDAAEMLICSGCEKSFHATCVKTPSPQTSFKWHCTQCTEANPKACSVCNNTTAADKQWLACDLCEERFHLQCLTPSLSDFPKVEYWFCSNCNLTDEEVTQLSVDCCAKYLL